MMICDTCQRDSNGLFGSPIWLGTARVCRDCFVEWYDGDGCVDPVVIGSRVRQAHGLEPIAKPLDASTSGAA